jgi:methylmalonyl-CoA mutase cobalamin-binding subunit
VVELLAEQGVDDVLVTVGVAAVFTPGAGTDEIVEFIRDGARRGSIRPLG